MLPIGIDDFEKVITQNFYYVDKTRLIADLCRSWGEVNLFTRPRRFGKSLNMSMLKSFFEIGCDRQLFDGLYISGENDVCEKYMGKFPVISITLKGAEGADFEMALESVKTIIGREAMHFQFLEKSTSLTEKDKCAYNQLTMQGDGADGRFRMSRSVLEDSIRTLSSLLARHYGSKVIILIDEYDVPLNKAFENGYYDEMTLLIRNLFGNALKSNSDLHFAVLTGCLRISKESIFTGLNNMKIMSLTDVRFDEYFGFTDSEVKQILEYYNLTEHYDVMKKWYDGYRFGNIDVYCPWDVINYTDLLCTDSQAAPQDFWSNTSGNAMVRRFIDKALPQTKKEIEELIAGSSIIKELRQELTYNELDSSIDNLWSVLFLTGYLTQRGVADGRRYNMAIPNNEIRNLFIMQIKEWFSENAYSDSATINSFCEAFAKGDSQTIEHLLGDYLWNTISIRDTAVRRERKENFYHGMLLGLLRYKESWLVMSNAETGEGYPDILIEVPQTRTGIVIEVKYAEDGEFAKACSEAIDQIEKKRYTARLEDDGMNTIFKYGIAFYRKRCKVIKCANI